MYDYVQGELVSLRDGHAVLDVNGVGYEFAVPASTAAAIEGRARIRLYSVLRIREDRLAHYGFATLEEREIFQRMCCVNGVGPATALAILSGLALAEFHEAVTFDKPQLLTRVKGVGRKTAERIVLELKGTLGSAPTGGALRPQLSGAAADALQMLVSIDYDEAAALDAVRRVIAELPGEAAHDAIFRAAQRLLRRGT